MEGRHIFPSFHSMSSDPDILVLRGYLVSGGFMTISTHEVISTTWLCIFILVIGDMSMKKEKEKKLKKI